MNKLLEQTVGLIKDSQCGKNIDQDILAEKIEILSQYRGLGTNLVTLYV